MNSNRIAWACAAVVAITVQAASNALFAYELADGMAPVVISGAKLSAIGLGFASMAVVIAISQAMAAAEFFRPGGSRALAATIALPCVIASVASIVSHVLAFQQARIERGAAAEAAYVGARNIRDTRQAEYAAAVKDRAAREADLAKRVAGRGIGEIDAAIAAVRVAPAAWRASEECTRIGDQWTATACEPLLKLRAERAATAERYAATEMLEAEGARVAAAAKALEEAERELSRTPQPPTPWPVRVMLAQVLPWVLAIVIELCGTLGLVMAERAGAKPARRPHEPAPPAPVQPSAPRAPAVGYASDLGALLEGLTTGKTIAPGCTVLADGWLDARQATLAKLLGVTAPTVSRQMDALESAGVVATRDQGGRKQVRVL